MPGPTGTHTRTPHIGCRTRGLGCSPGHGALLRTPLRHAVWPAGHVRRGLMAGALPREKRSFKPRALAWGAEGRSAGWPRGRGWSDTAPGAWRRDGRRLEAAWSHREDAPAGAQPLEEAIAPQGDAAEHRACASCPGPVPPPRG